MRTESSKFVDEGGVEHGVCLFLEGENPLFFASRDGSTTTDDLLRMIATIFIVATDAAQQSAIAGRKLVVVVEHDSGQRRSIDFILGFGRNFLTHARVEGVVAFEDENGLGL